MLSFVVSVVFNQKNKLIFNDYQVVFLSLLTELSHLFLRQRIERMKRILLYRTGIFEASKMLANKTRFVEDPRVPAVILAAQPIRIIRWSPATIIGIALKPHGIRGIREIRCRKNRWETSVISISVFFFVCDATRMAVNVS